MKTGPGGWEEGHATFPGTRNSCVPEDEAGKVSQSTAEKDLE